MSQQPPRPLPPEVAAALGRGQLIEAIKLLRKAQGYGLAEAKAALDAHVRKEMARRASISTGAPASVTHKPHPKAHPHPHALPARAPGLSPGEVPRTSQGPWIVLMLVIAALAAWYWLK